MALLDDYYKDYISLWNNIRKDFVGQLVSDTSTNYLLKRDSPGNYQIPYIEISEKLYKESPLLIVGMNPSGADVAFYDNNAEVVIYRGKSQYYEAMKSFSYECLKDIEEGVCMEEDAEGKYSELDLFGIVQGGQKFVEKHLYRNTNKYEKMLHMFLNYVVNTSPKVVIVANAFASKILKKTATKLRLSVYDRYNITPNEQFGGYDINIDNKKNFHVYFSTMLSGGHLDIGSRENLVWLVRNYLKNNP